MEEPRCYVCGGPISTEDTTPWDIRIAFRDLMGNLGEYTFTVTDDSYMAFGYLNGMYRRGFFARIESDGSHMHAIPTSQVIQVIVTPHQETSANA